MGATKRILEEIANNLGIDEPNDSKVVAEAERQLELVLTTVRKEVKNMGKKPKSIEVVVTEQSLLKWLFRIIKTVDPAKSTITDVSMTLGDITFTIVEAK